MSVASRTSRAYGRAVAFVVCLSAVVSMSVQGQSPETWTVSSDPTLRIGAVEGDPDYLFQSVTAALWASDGSVVVADDGYLSVRIFDPEGVLRTRIGRRGSGPGEFRQIMGLWLTPTGNLATWDPANRRVSQFSLEGELVTTSRVAGVPGNLEVWFDSFGDGEPVLASLFLGERRLETTPDPWVITRFGLDGQHVGHLGHVRGMWRYDRNPVPYSPMPSVAILGDRILVSDDASGSIDVRSSTGASIGQFTVQGAEAMVPEEQWASLERRLVEDEGEIYAASLSLEQLQKGWVPRVAPMPVIAALLVDTDGNVWAKRFDPDRDSIWLRRRSMQPGGGGNWWILDGDSGATVATVSLPDDLMPLAVDTDQILGISTDEFGVEYIVVHQLSR